MKRLLFFIAFMTLGTGLLLLVLVSEPVQQEVEEEHRAEVTNVLHMKTVFIRQLDGERVRWELWADEATIDEGTDTAELVGVRFNVYSTKEPASATPFIRGSSERALLNGQPARLVLSQRVSLFRGEELEIRTDRLEFDEARNLVASPQQVWLHTPNGIHTGDSMEYALAEEKVTLTRPRFYR